MTGAKKDVAAIHAQTEAIQQAIKTLAESPFESYGLADAPDLAAEAVKLTVVEQEVYTPRDEMHPRTEMVLEPESEEVELDITDMILSDLQELLPGSHVHYGDGTDDVLVRVGGEPSLRAEDGKVFLVLTEIELDTA